MSSHFDCYSFANGSYSCSVNRLFIKLHLGHQNNLTAAETSKILNYTQELHEVVRYRSKKEIESSAQNILDEVDYKSKSVNLENICSLLANEMGLIVEHNVEPTYDPSILGTLSFSPIKIKIFRSTNHNRERFTLAHEIGHLILGHGEFMKEEYTQNSDFRLENYSPDVVREIVRMEWQANYFASCLLLPADSLKQEFLRVAHIIDLRNKGRGFLYVDDQPVNLQNYRMVTNRLKLIFRASQQAVTIRLNEIGYLTDARKNYSHNIETFLRSD